MNIDMVSMLSLDIRIDLTGDSFEQVFTVYYNDKYVVVLALNVKGNNEVRIKHIIMIF